VCYPQKNVKVQKVCRRVLNKSQHIDPLIFRPFLMSKVLYSGIFRLD